MDVPPSNIIHNSTTKAIKYRQVEMTPIMMDPVKREQQMQDVRNAILQIISFSSLSGYDRSVVQSSASHWDIILTLGYHINTGISY